MLHRYSSKRRAPQGQELTIRLDDSSEHIFVNNGDEYVAPAKAIVSSPSRSSSGPEAKSPSPSSPLLSRPGSIRVSLLSAGRQSSKRLPHPDVEEKKLRLDDMVSDPKIRTEFISSLADNKELAVKVRFVAAVNEYERTSNKTEKKAKGNKIVSMFIQDGSLFQLTGIPQTILVSLRAAKLNRLVELKAIVLDDLVHQQQILKLMKDQISQRIFLSYQIPAGSI